MSNLNSVIKYIVYNEYFGYRETIKKLTMLYHQLKNEETKSYFFYIMNLGDHTDQYIKPVIDELKKNIKNKINFLKNNNLNMPYRCQNLIINILKYKLRTLKEFKID